MIYHVFRGPKASDDDLRSLGHLDCDDKIYTIEPEDGFNVNDYPELRPLDEFFAEEETRLLAEALGTTPFVAGNFYADVKPQAQDHWETHPAYLLAKTDIRREHLVPDVTGTLVTSLSAMNLYGLLAYRKHPKIRAFYVKAQR